MAHWTSVEKAFCVKIYLKSQSIKKTHAEFKLHFKTRKCPCKNIIMRWTQKFEIFGSTENRNSAKEGRVSHSGRPRSSRTLHNIDSVRDSVRLDGETSLRRRCQELNLRKDSLRRIIKSDLKLKNFKLHVKHQLLPPDYDKRMDMCRWFLQKLQENPDFLDTVWFSDEAHFHLSGQINSKNAYFWGDSPPDYVLEQPLHSPKCTAWAAISPQGIIGPFWFVDDDNTTTTVTAETYSAMVKRFVATLKRKRIPVRQQWLMQDGASSHTANTTLELLAGIFQERVVSRRTEVEWAPRSPDLNPLDFYLWGYLKGVVYRGKPATLHELKVAIETEIARIPLETCKAAVDNFKRRAQTCLDLKGGHIEHRFM